MTDATKTSSGVQELIGRIRDEGVRAGKSEADRVLRDAHAEATRILAEATAEAQAMRENARAEIEKNNAAAMEALRMAGRDSVLELRGRVTASFERYVKRLVTDATRDRGLLHALVLVLAGRAANEFIKDKNAQILVPELLAGGAEHAEELTERERFAVLSLSADMLREGIELISTRDFEGGARVRLSEENLEIDLSDEAITALLLKYLLPRFRAVVSGAE